MKHYSKKNYAYFIGDITFFLVGMAFFDASTVLPVFLATLTDSKLIIGIICSLRLILGFFPQLWTAHYLRNRTFHKSYLIKLALMSRIAMTLFAVLVFFSKPEDKLIMLVGFFLMQIVLWGTEGFLGVSWFDIVAKSVHENYRGRLFGLTVFLSGIISVFVGVFVSKMLSPNSLHYPQNYGVLMACLAFCAWGSFICVSFVKEPEGKVEEMDDNFMIYLKQVWETLKSNDQFKRLIIIQILSFSFLASLSFYILYAQQVIGISVRDVGLLLSIQMIGTIIWSALTGYLSDHKSPKYGIIATVAMGVIAPVLALIIKSPSLFFQGTIFFAIGGINGTLFVGLPTYMLASAKPEERRTHIGIMNTTNAASAIFPILGGFIVQLISYQAIFIFTAICLTYALILALKLKRI